MVLTNYTKNDSFSYTPAPTNGSYVTSVTASYSGNGNAQYTTTGSDGSSTVETLYIGDSADGDTGT